MFQTLKGAKDPLSSLGSELRPCGIVGEESLGLLEEKVDFREGLVTDALPANAAGGIDEEGPVEGNFFEIVVGPVSPEGGELGIGDKRKGNGVTSLFIGFEGLGELGLGLGADGDDFETRFPKSVHLGSDGLELLDAMEATETEVENHHDGAASIVGEREALAGRIGQSPARPKQASNGRVRVCRGRERGARANRRGSA